MFYPFHQLGVSPGLESIQVGVSRVGHRDHVVFGPDLQTHQTNKRLQGFVSLQVITTTTATKVNYSVSHSTSPTEVFQYNERQIIKSSSLDDVSCLLSHKMIRCGICPGKTAAALTHHVDKVDDFKYPLSQLGQISVHLYVLKQYLVA